MVFAQNGNFTYQYHLKDHLGNVRLTFTTKDEKDISKATMETANSNTEQGQFLYYDEAVKVNSTIFDHTDVGPTWYSTRLNGSTNERFGLAKSLSVMPGDTVRAEVYAKYLDPNNSNWTAALNSLITSIGNGTAPGGTFIDGGLPGSTGGVAIPYAGALDKASETGSAPKAYLNYIVFDRDFNLKDGGYVRVTTAGREYGQDAPHEKLAKELVITEPGYVYLYISNDNVSLGGGQVEVYFDDFKVEHRKSPVVQSQDYYPFGLRFNSYTRENSLIERSRLFQGQEHVDDLGLNWDSFKWRNHQPEIGRFFNVDPLSEKYLYNSPYAFSENRVTTHVELEGKEALHYMENAPDGSRRHVLEKNVIVLTKEHVEVRGTARQQKKAERQNRRVDAENAARVEKVTLELHNYFNGEAGQARNSKGEPVRFQFNIREAPVANPAPSNLDNLDIKDIARLNGLEGAPDRPGGSARLVPGVVVTQGTYPTGINNQLYTMNNNDIEGSIAHEVGHTLMTGGPEESQPSSGGLMVDPPSLIKPNEVDKMLKDSIPRNNN